MREFFRLFMNDPQTFILTITVTPLFAVILVAVFMAIKSLKEDE